MIQILIADDEMLERMFLRKVLEKNFAGRCEILEAGNGREVLEVWRERQPEVLILDIEMPGVSGLEAAAEIRRTDRTCGIIFLTAYDEFAYAKKAITVRALDYLLKPFEERELLLVTEEAVHHAEMAGHAAARAPELLPSAKDETENESQQHETGSARAGWMAETMRAYIAEHYMQDISMQDAAREMNYSDAYFSKLFRQCFGKNFTACLTEYRVAKAKKLLEDPAVNIKEAGRRVGYGDANYFAKVFKRIAGMTPTDYRSMMVPPEQG